MAVKKKRTSLLAILLKMAVFIGFSLVAWLFYFSTAALTLPQTPFEFSVKPGATLKSLSRQFVDDGLLTEPNSFWLLGRVLSKTTIQKGNIQAGRYRLESPITPYALLQKLNDGEVIPVMLTFVEGTTFRDMLQTLRESNDIRHTLDGKSSAEILQSIGANETQPEGLFFPDTYRFAAGAADIDILKRSYQTMQKKLNEAWMQRDKDLPYETPYQALIMASIIEKETGRADDRPMVASVFINRLKLPMRLQTDPTVIYGMGEKYDGNIRKRDLETDTPYNTYTRDGLPPTPIALPGWASLLAAVKPAASDKLYFVAKRASGDGSSHFSRTLEEHNRAVAKYQLGR